MWKKFNVFGTKVPVLYFDGDEENKDLYGYCEKSPIRIYINSSLSKQEQIITCLHELHHSLCFRLGFDQILDDTMMELMAEAFADVVYDNFIKKK